MKNLLLVVVMFILCDRFINYKINQIRTHMHICKNDKQKVLEKAFSKDHKLIKIS